MDVDLGVLYIQIGSKIELLIDLSIFSDRKIEDRDFKKCKKIERSKIEIFKKCRSDRSKNFRSSGHY